VITRAQVTGLTLGVILGVSATTLLAPVQASVQAPVQAPVQSPTSAPGSKSSPRMTYEEYRAETFIASQNAIISEASDALNQVSARFAEGQDQVGALASRREAMAKELANVTRQIEEAFKRTAPADPAQAASVRADVERLQSRSETLSADLRKLNEEIVAKFPAFAELTRPQALDYAQVQRLLGPDEAVIVFVTANDATYSWAVTREGFDWARSEATKGAKLAEAVTKLRSALTSTPASRGGIGSRTTQQERALKGQGSGAVKEQETGAPAFDRTLAHQLYLDLIKPLEPVVGGKRVVMAVTSGPLASLPLQVLVTAQPTGDDRDLSAMASTQWMADKYVLSTLPTVSSLRALRCFLASPGRPANPGCPANSQGSSRQSNAQQGTGPRVSFAGFGAPVLAGSVAINRGAPQFQSAFEDKLADPDVLRQLPSLPGTAQELTGVARQFGRQAHIFLAAEATETAVRTSTLLPRARYVVFATHGLLAGQSGVAGEPGLVFTPPAKAARSAQDDGLLTASEAAQLRLSADFVVLSACNTASSDGRLGGDGLSGLARSFFYAGAPAVLASHWEVSDAATAQLMVETFANLDRRTIRGRGEALQRAQARLRQSGRPEWVHPNYWAAFTLAGEAN
jgi:CHAT domain-containing protein